VRNDTAGFYLKRRINHYLIRGSGKSRERVIAESPANREHHRPARTLTACRRANKNKPNEMLMTNNRIELEEPAVRRGQQNEIRNTKGVFDRTDKTSTSTNEPMSKANSRKTSELLHRRDAPLETRTDLTASATKDITAAMNAILADVFALYMKTKNFHWHMSGPHFRDYHLLLDEHADQLFAMTDPIAERVRKIGGLTLHSTGQISRTQRVLDNDAEYVEPLDMLAELADDNRTMAARLREAHNVCDDHRDVATASLIEVWIDETERRAWFLFEATRRVN
jgi:starvation-inducible DNA-binding protein